MMLFTARDRCPQTLQLGHRGNILDAEAGLVRARLREFLAHPPPCKPEFTSLQSRATSIADLVDWLESVAFDDIDEDACRLVVAFFGPLHRLGVSNTLERQAP
jgi:hypothetical protein